MKSKYSHLEFLYSFDKVVLLVCQCWCVYPFKVYCILFDAWISKASKFSAWPKPY